MAQLPGIDVSAAQGQKLDWPSIARAGIRFTLCKASEHVGYVDPTFHRNVMEADKVGIVRGSYHFFRVEADPEKQAQLYFRTAVQWTELPPAMDFESLRGVAPKVARPRAFAFMKATEALWGRPCMVYTYPSFWDGLGNPAAPEFGARPLWIANYGVKKPKLPRPWSAWTFWQYDGNGGKRLPQGIDSDFNWFNGDEAALKELCARRVTTSHPVV